MPGNPRRAFEHEEGLLTVSDSNVRAFSLENLAVAHQTADVVIGTCVPEMDTFVGPPNGTSGGWGRLRRLARARVRVRVHPRYGARAA